MDPIWFKSWPDGIPRQIEYPETTLPQVTAKHAREIPGREAINFYGCRISYDRLEKMTSAFAASLSARGIKKGDRVCLFMENCPQFIIATLGIWRTGAVAVPANPMFKEEELKHQLNDSGSKAIVLLDLLYPVLERIKGETPLENIIITGYRDFLPPTPGLPLHPSLEVPRQRYEGTVEMLPLLGEVPGPDPAPIRPGQDLALLQYTAGATGTPKGAMITHANMLSNTICSAIWNKAGEGIHLAVLPLFHVTGLVHSMNMPLYTGGTIILLARFDTETVIRAIEKYRVTHWAGIATMNIALVNYPDVKNHDLTSLKTCVSGGAPIPIKILEDLTGSRATELKGQYGLVVTAGGDGNNVEGSYTGEYSQKGGAFKEEDTLVLNMNIGGNEAGAAALINVDMRENSSARVEVPALTVTNSTDLASLTGMAKPPAGIAPVMVFLDGRPMQFDVFPYVKDGRVMVSVRSLAEALGCSVAWRDPNQVTITRSDLTVIMYVNERQYTSNGQSMLMDIAPEVKNGRNIVPLRFIVEEMGCSVEYDEVTGRVDVYTNR